MRYGRTVAGLRADVKRLEKATAKGGRPCACCLLHRLSGPVLRSGEPPPPAEEALVIPCEFCGRGRVYDVTGRPVSARTRASRAFNASSSSSTRNCTSRCPAIRRR